MTSEPLLHETHLEEAFGSPEAAERVFWAAVDALGTTIQADDRRAMAEALGEPLGPRLIRAHFDEDAMAESTFAQVADATQLPLGQAREVVQIVARTLASGLPETVRARLERHAGPGLDELWAPAPKIEPPPRPVHPPPPGHGHTLASGRPGSRHPLFEAGPMGHVDSVALNPDPHGDTKLSGAKGTSAEREHRTLAEGRPGSRHPLSEAGED